MNIDMVTSGVGNKKRAEGERCYTKNVLKVTKSESAPVLILELEHSKKKDRRVNTWIIFSTIAISVQKKEETIES